jgi:hypothetical protein
MGSGQSECTKKEEQIDMHRATLEHSKQASADADAESSDMFLAERMG